MMQQKFIFCLTGVQPSTSVKKYASSRPAHIVRMNFGYFSPSAQSGKNNSLRCQLQTWELNGAEFAHGKSPGSVDAC